MGFVTCAETSNLEDREREQDAESRVEADVGSGASLVTWCHVLSSRAVFFQRHLLNVELQLQQCSTQPGRMAFKGKSFVFGKILSKSHEPRETLLKHHGPDDNLAR